VQSSQTAIAELLEKHGCDQIAIIRQGDESGVQFVLDEMPFLIRVDAQRVAARAIAIKPYHPRTRCNRAEYDQKMLDQARKVVWRHIHDWIRTALNMVENGMIDMITAFLPYLMTRDGGTLGTYVRDNKAKFISESSSGFAMLEGKK